MPSQAKWMWPLPVVAALCGCSPGADEPIGEFPEDPYATAVSESGALRIEVRTAPAQPPSPGDLTIELLIADEQTGAAMDGLDLAFVAWMPSHEHGAPVPAVVTAEGEGHYVARPVSLHMPGVWELRTTISGTASDRAVLTLDVH